MCIRDRNDTALEKDLIDAYPIKRAVIVPDLVENEQILLQDVCAALIDDLPRYVKNDSVIGVFYAVSYTHLKIHVPLSFQLTILDRHSTPINNAFFESPALICPAAIWYATINPEHAAFKSNAAAFTAPSSF